MTLATYEQLFRNRSFRRFWLGFTFSVLGDTMTRVALTWYVYETTGSATALGWLMLCYSGPVVVGGLLAGSLLDRFDRRMVMLVDNLIRGVAVVCVPLLAALGRLELWHVYAVAAAYGMLMMISLAGGPSLIPSLVHHNQLSTANAMEMLSFTPWRCSASRSAACSAR
jgi:MFS family permease